MYQNRFTSYVPEPQSATTDRVIGVHYYPGWTRCHDKLQPGFEVLKHFPERCPVLGWYDESNPEVTDWEIKWAVEHGINCFIYCWYRLKENMGKPVTREALRFGHAIHDGLFKAAYRNFIQFAIMFENQSLRWGNAADLDDLLHNLLPWWVNEYFSKPNYLKFDGKPVLFIYSMKDFLESIGGEEAMPEVLVKMNEEIQKYGFPGIHVSIKCGATDENYMATVKAHLPVHDMRFVDRVRSFGFDSGFQYVWNIHKAELTEEQYTDYMCMDPQYRSAPPSGAIAAQLTKIKDHTEYAPDFFMITASVGTNRKAWRKIQQFKSLGTDPGHVLVSQLPPYAFKILLQKIKPIVDKMPENSPGRKMLILDNWNEWGEGHFISPSCAYGFQYLQAVREVFSECDNLPDYRTPQLLDFDRYDYEWFPENN